MFSIEALLLLLAVPQAALGGDIWVTPSLTVEEQYESNPGLKAKGETAEEDFVTTVSPSVDIKGDWKKLAASARYRFNTRFYSKFDELDYQSHSAGIIVDYNPSRKTGIKISDTAAYTQDSLETGVADIQVERTNMLSNSLSMTAGRQFTGAFSSEIGVSDSMAEFDSPSLVDSRTDAARAQARYILTPRTSVKAQYEYIVFSFDLPEGVKADDSVENHSLQIGAESELAKSFTLSATAGAFYTVDTGGFNWVAELRIGKEFQYSSASAVYSRSVTNTFGLSQEMNIRDSVSATIGWRPAESLTVGVSGSYSRNRSEPSSDIDLISYTAGMDIGWRPLRWLNVAVGYSHFEQESSGVIGYGTARDRAFVRLTGTPDAMRL